MFPKLHHGGSANTACLASLDAGWHTGWRAAGCRVVGWGWLEGDPVAEAELAVSLCSRYRLDGYIANCEAPYEGAGKWRSQPFVARFRDLAPHAPLGLSYIGYGVPYRDLDFDPWLYADAAFLPQCYDGTSATSIWPSLAAAGRAGIPKGRVFPTLGTSGFEFPYDPAGYRAELQASGAAGFSVWLLESTSDDALRTLG